MRYEATIEYSQGGFTQFGEYRRVWAWQRYALSYLGGAIYKFGLFRLVLGSLSWS